MTLPNILTIIRLLLVPVFIYTFSIEGDAKIYSAIIFIIASITDVLDGLIARRFNLGTKLGQVLDPLADKLMQISVIVMLVISNAVPMWFIVFFVIKEAVQVAGATFLFIRKADIKSNIFGKINTVLMFFAIVAVMAFPGLSRTAENIMLAICAVFGILAFVSYLYSYILKQKKYKQYVKRGEQL